MPDPIRDIECRGGPLDGGRVSSNRIDSRGRYFHPNDSDTGRPKSIACYTLDDGTGCLHYTETAIVRNARAKA